MEAPSMDTIYQAISALYDNPNAHEKEKASLWLGDVQKSIHSWKIADELLHQKKDIHSCYFAAQTMRSKVQHNLSELPEDALVSLRNSLIAYLESASPDTSAPILTQLCLALSDLALQMSSWQNCVSDLIKSFSNKNYFVLIEILTVLPQEIDSSTLKLGENRRGDIKNDLRSNSQMMTQFLKESLNNSQNSHIALKVIKCMTSWVQVQSINIQEVPQNAIIGLCLQVLGDHNTINTLHDAATDCVCALLHCLEDNNNCEEVERLLFDSVSNLEQSYHVAVANEEEEKASNYARVFTELAESFLMKIIISAANGQPHFAIRSLDLCLIVVGHHDYDIAEITFNLWYRLSEEVYQRDDQALTDALKPVVERLIAALARHCQCEPDLASLPQEGDDFYVRSLAKLLTNIQEFRLKVEELIKDVVFVVGSAAVFRRMVAALRDNTSWEQTEAALFVMQAVAKNILPDESEYVPHVVEAILSLPANTHLAVRATSLSVLGGLSEWLQQHPSSVGPALQALLEALHEPSLQCHAATALMSVCSACRGLAPGQTGSLLRAAAASPALPPPAAVALTRALANALSDLPAPQLEAALREAASVHLDVLKELMASDKPIKKNSLSDPSLPLDRLAALFRDVQCTTTTASTHHPAVAALADAWPVLQDVMDRWRTDGRVMERACRCLRFGLRCVGRHGAAILPPLAAALGALYTAHAHSCLLYLASILVDELYAAPGCSQHLIGLLQALMPRAFELLQQPGGLKDNPDTVDDLFRLCIRFLQRIPLEFLRASAATAAVVQCAALASALDHRDANSSVMKFLYDLIKAATAPRQNKEQVKALASEVLETYGETLTYALMEATVLHLHSYMLAEVAEVLVELLPWQRAAGHDWLRTALSRLPTDRACATQQQCWQFHQYAMRTEKCKEMTRLLRDFARLYR